MIESTGQILGGFNDSQKRLFPLFLQFKPVADSHRHPDAFGEPRFAQCVRSWKRLDFRELSGEIVGRSPLMQKLYQVDDNVFRIMAGAAGHASSFFALWGGGQCPEYYPVPGWIVPQEQGSAPDRMERCAAWRNFRGALRTYECWRRFAAQAARGVHFAATVIFCATS
ncbi:hypothetical protein [Paucimonas lemoignei]|uniref:hypothetical protein n=1 Tax=Paucimonas lemoignei TaxID=29443 RepID=UPI001FB2045E|nr:hypothetical protein [Paucimonas lemoignei]